MTDGTSVPADTGTTGTAPAPAGDTPASSSPDTAPSSNGGTVNPDQTTSTATDNVSPAPESADTAGNADAENFDGLFVEESPAPDAQTAQTPASATSDTAKLPQTPEELNAYVLNAVKQFEEERQRAEAEAQAIANSEITDDEWTDFGSSLDSVKNVFKKHGDQVKAMIAAREDEIGKRFGATEEAIYSWAKDSIVPSIVAWQKNLATRARAEMAIEFAMMRDDIAQQFPAEVFKRGIDYHLAKNPNMSFKELFKAVSDGITNYRASKAAPERGGGSVANTVAPTARGESGSSLSDREMQRRKILSTWGTR